MEDIKKSLPDDYSEYLSDQFNSSLDDLLKVPTRDELMIYTMEEATQLADKINSGSHTEDDINRLEEIVYDGNADWSLKFKDLMHTLPDDIKKRYRSNWNKEIDGLLKYGVPLHHCLKQKRDAKKLNDELLSDERCKNVKEAYNNSCELKDVNGHFGQARDPNEIFNNIKATLLDTKY